jgi:hypothetical protein
MEIEKRKRLFPPINTTARDTVFRTLESDMKV